MTVQDMDRLFDEYEGKFPFYSSLGAYPVIYLTENGNVLCADCATKEILAWRENESDDPPVLHDTYYEGPTIQCDDCNRDIESAYGDPDDYRDATDNDDNEGDSES